MAPKPVSTSPRASSPRLRITFRERLTIRLRGWREAGEATPTPEKIFLRLRGLRECKVRLRLKPSSSTQCDDAEADLVKLQLGRLGPTGPPSKVHRRQQEPRGNSHPRNARHAAVTQPRVQVKQERQE